MNIGINEAIKQKTIMSLKLHEIPNIEQQQTYIYPPFEDINTLDKLTNEMKRVLTYYDENLHDKIIQQLYYRHVLFGTDRYQLYDVARILKTKTPLNENEVELLKWMILEEPGWFFSYDTLIYWFKKGDSVFVWKTHRWLEAEILKTPRNSCERIIEYPSVKQLEEKQTHITYDKSCIHNTGKHRYKVRYTDINDRDTYNKHEWVDIGKLRVNRDNQEWENEEQKLRVLEIDEQSERFIRQEVIPIIQRAIEIFRRNVRLLVVGNFLYRISENDIFSDLMNDIRTGSGIPNNTFLEQIRESSLRDMLFDQECILTIERFPRNVNLENLRNNTIIPEDRGVVRFLSIYIPDRTSPTLKVDFITGENEFKKPAMIHLIERSNEIRIGTRIRTFVQMTTEALHYLTRIGIVQPSKERIINHYRDQIEGHGVEDLDDKDFDTIIANLRSLANGNQEIIDLIRFMNIRAESDLDREEIILIPKEEEEEVEEEGQIVVVVQPAPPRLTKADVLNHNRQRIESYGVVIGTKDFDTIINELETKAVEVQLLDRQLSGRIAELIQTMRLPFISQLVAERGLEGELIGDEPLSEDEEGEVDEFVNFITDEPIEEEEEEEEGEFTPPEREEEEEYEEDEELIEKRITSLIGQNIFKGKRKKHNLIGIDLTSVLKGLKDGVSFAWKVGKKIPWKEVAKTVEIAGGGIKDVIDVANEAAPGILKGLNTGVKNVIEITKEYGLGQDEVKGIVNATVRRLVAKGEKISQDDLTTPVLNYAILKKRRKELRAIQTQQIPSLGIIQTAQLKAQVQNEILEVRTRLEKQNQEDEEEEKKDEELLEFDPSKFVKLEKKEIKISPIQPGDGIKYLPIKIEIPYPIFDPALLKRKEEKKKAVLANIVNSIDNIQEQLEEEEEDL